MVARSPALLSLGLAAFLRSLLPAQPAPCPQGASARAAFRKPRLRGGSLGRPWASGPHPAAPGRSSERLPSLRRLLGGSAARGPQVGPGDTGGRPEQLETPDSPRVGAAGVTGPGGERGWGAGLGPSASPGSGEQVGRGGGALSSATSRLPRPRPCRAAGGHPG